MFFIALVTIIGLGVGFAAALVTGVTPSQILSRLRNLRIEHWPVLVLGAVLLLAVSLDTNMLAGRFALGISLTLLFAGCLLNRHITGASVAAVGIAANLVVLLMNGYLPMSEGAVVAAGIVEVEGLDRVLLGAPRRWSSDSTIAAWLGGTIPLAPLRDVITLGDLLTAVGFANVGFRLMWPVALARQRLEAMPVVEAEEYDDTSVVLRPASSPTTLEHPPLVGAAAAESSASTAAAATAPGRAAATARPPAATPAPVIHQPMWASRVEPAPWPAPAPWTDGAEPSAQAPGDEPAERRGSQMFDT